MSTRSPILMMGQAVAVELKAEVQAVLLLDILVGHFLRSCCLLEVFDHLLLGQAALLLLRGLAALLLLLRRQAGVLSMQRYARLEAVLQS